MNKGTIILICGLPGSGKTTLAKILEKERNAITLSADEWIIEIIKNKSQVSEIDRLRKPVEKMLFKLAAKLAAGDSIIILDNGFWTISDRKEYLKKAKELNLKIELHFLDAAPEILIRRLSKRNKNVPSYDFEIDLNKMERWTEIFETPTDDEIKNFDYYKKYDQSISLI